ncbi:serine hydrolase domain-containing protein [Prosthecobacter sp. SYSU 5D2]|uniref:serine hydrolase domain-containing protein n=1 Tax=Prosthecobacter sp. SYSU 5D2 TaxID=3134134 RepID=UPI0031FF42A1
MHAITDSALTTVKEWFEENFRSRGELGASVSIWQNGIEVLSLAHGFCDRQSTRPWTADTLVPVFSSTKAPAAVCCLMALEEAGLPLDSAVSEVWPEFVGGGKGEMQFAHLLSHTAGLCAMDERVPIFNYEAVVEALERQVPLWEPGTKQGYHARTFGFLMDEIVRRITGVDSLGLYFRDTFATPMGLDFWIGLPEQHWPRVSPVYPGRISIANSDQPFLKAYNNSSSLTHRTFVSPFGLNAVSEYNTPELWAPGFASMGGVGTAHGLGQFYAMLAQGGLWKGQRLVSEAVLKQLGHTLSQEEDSVLLTPIAFAAGVMQDPLSEDGSKLRQHFGPSLTAFGHPGAGGSLCFADPENRIALAYVMNQMEFGTLPGPKVLGMVERLYA